MVAQLTSANQNDAILQSRRRNSRLTRPKSDYCVEQFDALVVRFPEAAPSLVSYRRMGRSEAAHDEIRDAALRRGESMDFTARTRRQFLAGACNGLSVAWIAGHWPGIAAAHTHAAAAATNPGASTFVFLTLDEARDVEAIAAQIVPTDDTPGAREAGALYFIDRSLHTWAAATAESFRAGLGDFQSRFAAAHSALCFAAADGAAQVAFLTQVETTGFFATVRFLTLLGMFASPSYGGNRRSVGWRLLGFDDVHAFTPPFGYYDRDYPGFEVPKEGA